MLRDRRPLYLQTIDALNELIASNEFHEGELLPSEEMLSRRLGVSRLTLREALAHLEKDGLVVRKQGSGTFVAMRKRERLLGGLEYLVSFRSLCKQVGLEADVFRREISQVAASPKCAEKLEIKPGEPLVRVEMIEGVEGRPVIYMDSYAPCAQVELAALSNSGGSLLEYLNEVLYSSPAYTHSEIYSLGVQKEIAVLLGIEVNQPVLHLIETYYAEDDRPVAISFNYFLTDSFNFYVNRRVVKPTSQK